MAKLESKHSPQYKFAAFFNMNNHEIINQAMKRQSVMFFFFNL